MTTLSQEFLKLKQVIEEYCRHVCLTIRTYHKKNFKYVYPINNHSNKSRSKIIGELFRRIFEIAQRFVHRLLKLRSILYRRTEAMRHQVIIKIKPRWGEDSIFHKQINLQFIFSFLLIKVNITLFILRQYPVLDWSATPYFYSFKFMHVCEDGVCN